MNLTLKQWGKILREAESNNPDNGDMFEQVKENLKQQDESMYKQWKEESFDARYLFCTAGENDNRFTYSRTLLYMAACHNRLGIVRYLVLEKNVDVNQTGSCGVVALHTAAGNGHKDVVNALLNIKEINVNKQDETGYTPLHWAVIRGHKDVVDALLKAERIDVNKHNKDGNTSLHIAAESGYVGIIKALLNKKADPSLKNKKDKTPRDLATDENVIHLLKDAEQATLQAEVSSISNEADSKFYGSGENVLHSTKGNKLPIITTSIGLLLGLSIAYFAGAAALTIVGAVTVFVTAAVVGTLVGYGVGKFCEKVSEERQKNPDIGTWDAAKSVLSDVFTTGHPKEHQV